MLDSDPDMLSVYDGVVVDNVDPLRIGRLRVSIPGLIEPYSDWAMPACYPGAGSDARGLWCIPTIGSNVTVAFSMGDPDVPRYWPGGWAAPNDLPLSPTFVRDLTPAEAVEVTGLQTRRWEIILDDRDGVETLMIRDRKFPNSNVRIDGPTQFVQISGQVGVQIKSSGIVNIDALQVTINGRIVLPTNDPI